MPEGDAVWRTARRLHQALAGMVLTGCDLRVPKLATSDLSGRATIEVVPRGKHLLHRVEGDLTLHSHLRMDGSWRVRSIGARYAAARRHTTRALLWTAESVAIGDRLGMLDLVRTQDEHRVVGHLGPDLLDLDFDLDAAVRNLRAQPGRPLAEALLDQRKVAGIGTIYASEPLFRLRINPWLPVGELPSDVLSEVLTTARDMMIRACKEPRLASDARGAPRAVFGRSGMPCRVCGATVREGAVGEQPQQRKLAYCPACQA